ncbi:MAG: ribbon-helix-helix protein, CopG family [Actinobacteria bacterium]|nr:ribbon-helix-helix protein, CopG family [Actinomycetota bacterium]
MTEAISVRLDDDAARALNELEATGLNRSDAVRTALVAAARRLRDRRRLADEVAALEADADDRALLRDFADVMEDLRAPW